MASKGKNSGGAATQIGINYQNRVAAWVCVRILAEHEVSPIWELSSDTTFEFLRCETEQPVDDILVGTSKGGYVFINVKHSVGASKLPDSPLSSVINQFVKQFISYKGNKNGERPWEREINSSIDRFVLVTRLKENPEAISEYLPKVLAKTRNISQHDDINIFTNNLPESERKIFKILRENLANSWTDLTASKISDEDELQLLKLIWIEILDVDENTNGEREAKQVLRNTILQNSNQSEIAWDSLIQACANFASRQSGADRKLLQNYLISRSIHVKSPRSYLTDIEKLRSQTKQTVGLLQELSTIRVGDKKVKITRHSTEVLFTTAEKHSLVVVGEPGAGKSGALHDLVEILINEDRDVIFFAVDRVEANSLSNLRNELNLKHNLIDIIKNWSGDKPAFLIIDALDAARSESAAQTFYDLISLTLQDSNRWKVIASIREFDLRHHVKLRRLFAGSPPTEFRAQEFYDLCHFKVPPLGKEEWQQIESQSAELAKLINEAAEPLRSLLKVPFNLRLVGELIGSGVSIENLSPIRTQIELLDRYWEERVVRSDDEGDARQAILLNVVEVMTNSRTLRASRSSIITKSSNASRTIKQLLSSYILSEWKLPGGGIESSVLTFAHHVLFDYAVSRLLLRGETNNLVRFLEKDIDLVLAVRPSIVMYFQYLWLTNSNLFWEVYFNVIRSEQIPEIGKLIGASVIVELPLNTESFIPLIKNLSSQDIKQNEVAEKAFRHITGALLAITSPFSNFKLIGESAAPWCELLDDCTVLMRVNLAYSVRPILWVICRNHELFTESQRYHAGRVARRLFEFALSQEPRDSGLVFAGIETVCKTFESDSTTSANLLRRCLQPEHVRAFGHEELFRFGEEIERLIPLAPDLVEEMYIATFTNYDYSEEKTYTIASRILPLTSTRKQDFHMAQYSFANKYRKFLEIAPLKATNVVLVAMNAHINERNRNRRFWDTEIFPQNSTEEQDVTGEKFIFDAQEVSIVEDHSAIWDDSFGSQDEYSIQILSSFENYLRQLSAKDGKPDLLRKILRLLVHEAQYAVFWRKLIIVGTEYPDTLGYEIRSLAWTKPILTLFDTSTAIGDFITSVFGNLTEEERVKIEQAILEIPQSVDDDQREHAEYKRNRLLGCLNRDAVVSNEAKKIINQLEAENNIPQNNPPFRTSFSTGQFTDEDYLKEQGVSLEDDQNRRILELCQPAKAFAASYQNSTPTTEEFISIIPHLQTLYQTLTEEDATIHERQKDMAWGYLADACSSAVKIENWSCDLENSNLIKTILLKCASYSDPLPHPENNEFFDDHPSWGSAARIDAAEGLIRLARHESCVDEDTKNVIKQLGLFDEVPAVRFQIATHLTSLYYSAPDLMWFLLETMSKEEQRTGILSFLINMPLHNLAGHHPDKVTELTKNIFDRIREGKGASEVRKNCASIFLGLYIWKGQRHCEELINEIVIHPALYNTEIHKIVFDLRSYLNLGLDDLSNKEKQRVRAKAVQLMERALLSTKEATDLIEKKNENTPFNLWIAEDQETGRILAHLAESIGNQIYFASGAFKENHGNNKEDNVPMGTESRKVFFLENKHILELLADFGYASLTHHLLETLEFFTTYSPKDIFLLIGKVVRSGKQSGYQYESMAADLVVKLVERFIAEFRYIFQEDEGCRRVLIEILDIFVEAGWASARRLTYGVEDIFR
jgi:signal recognition particle GTPase